MSKAALNQFIQCAANGFGPKGIRIYAVNPGVIDTPLYDLIGTSAGAPEDFAKIYPVGRAELVSDTSNAISFLASEAHWRPAESGWRCGRSCCLLNV